MTTQGMYASAQFLGQAKTECWDLVARFNASDCSAREVFAAREQLNALCEIFRRRFFPRAREVFVVCDHNIGQPLMVFRRTPTGRPVLVFEEAA